PHAVCTATRYTTARSTTLTAARSIILAARRRPRATSVVTRSVGPVIGHRADPVSVHLPERIADELDARAVGIAQVEGRPVHVLVLDAGLVELRLETVPAIRRHRDREVV